MLLCFLFNLKVLDFRSLNHSFIFIIVIVIQINIIIKALFHPSTFEIPQRYRPYGRPTATPTLSPRYLDRYNLTTKAPEILRGDQMPIMDDQDEDEDYAEMPPIIFHLNENHRHPLQYTRSTRIPLYHVNHIKRGSFYLFDCCFSPTYTPCVNTLV